MPLSEIRAEYKTILSTVPDIGVVHDYERWSADWAKFLEQFKDPATGKIRGWTITRERSPEVFGAGSSYERGHVMVLRGYMGLHDVEASEKVFQDLIETVCDTFRPKTTLNGKVQQVEAPLQVDVVEARMLGSVLCHYCELRQTVTEAVQAFSQS